jgi:hypothetical protein
MEKLVDAASGDKAIVEKICNTQGHDYFVAERFQVLICRHCGSAKELQAKP